MERELIAAYEHYITLSESERKAREYIVKNTCDICGVAVKELNNGTWTDCNCNPKKGRAL
jgi:hypothetical protein